MSYSIGKTPTIDEVVVKVLSLPVISDEVHPYDSLPALMEVLDDALNPDVMQLAPELSADYRSFSPSLLIAARELVKRRISYANALDEYLVLLHQESTEQNSSLTVNSENQSTLRFNIEELDYHLKSFLLQGNLISTPEPDRRIGGPETQAEASSSSATKKQRGPLAKTLNNTYLTCFLIADCFAKEPKYRIKGELNIDAISKKVQMHCIEKYPMTESQSDSIVRNRLNFGKKSLQNK